MLTEGRVGDHLAQEVEIRRHQRQDAAADEHRHVCVVGQSHVLQEGVSQRSDRLITIDTAKLIRLQGIWLKRLVTASSASLHGFQRYPYNKSDLKKKLQQITP